MASYADVIAETIASHGVEYVFGLPGGEIVAFMDSCRRAGMRFFLTGHESSAAWMAQVFGQISAELRRHESMNATISPPGKPKTYSTP